MTSRPCPSIATACVCIHSWNAARVFGSNVRRISSSSTVSEMLPSGSSPPSSSARAPSVPGVSSTYVSPSSVFCRRIACASEGSGAYFERSSIVTIERPVSVSGSIALTLPTGTPEIRTSASVASCDAWANDAVTR